MKQGFGNCSDCGWFNNSEGCNVERGSSICLLNKHPKDIVKKTGTSQYKRNQGSNLSYLLIKEDNEEM